MPPESMYARAAWPRGLASVGVHASELEAAFAGVLFVGLLEVPAELLVGHGVREGSVHDRERGQRRWRMRGSGLEGPGRLRLSTAQLRPGPSRAVPWQAQQQALFVEVLASRPFRLQEGAAAHAEVLIRPADSTLDAHSLSEEAATQRGTWVYVRARLFVVVAVRGIVCDQNASILEDGVLVCPPGSGDGSAHFCKLSM